jgi:hypothetical protein
MARCNYHYADNEKNREKNRVGEQCGLGEEVNGFGRCKFHGGRNPAFIAKMRREQVQRDMDADVAEGRFTAIWPSDHELLDPFSLLLWEIRRSGARIEWLDGAIRRLDAEKEIWWGITKEEHVGAAEFAGTNKTYEARENILIKMQNDERKRLFDLTKEWQGQKFEAAKIASMGAFAISTRAMIHALAEALGADLTDEGTQDIVQRVLTSQPPLMIESERI